MNNILERKRKRKMGNKTSKRDITTYITKEYVVLYAYGSSVFETEWNNIDYIKVDQNRCITPSIVNLGQQYYDIYWKDDQKEKVTIKASEYRRKLRKIPVDNTYQPSPSPPQPHEDTLPSAPP